MIAILNGFVNITDIKLCLIKVICIRIHITIRFNMNFHIIQCWLDCKTKDKEDSSESEKGNV